MPILRPQLRRIVQSAIYNATSGALPGPPSFAYKGKVAGSNSSAVTTFTNIPIGAASTNRFVVITVSYYGSFGGGALVSGSFTGGTATAVQITNSSTTTLVVYGTISGGTVTTLTLTFTNNIFNQGVAYAYTTDVTTLSSTTPVTQPSNVTATTTETTSIPIANSGSAIFLIEACGAGSTNNSQAVTSSGAGFASTGDDAFGGSFSAHVNNVAATGSSSATVSWTGTADNSIGLIVFR